MPNFRSRSCRRNTKGNGTLSSANFGRGCDCNGDVVQVGWNHWRPKTNETICLKNGSGSKLQVFRKVQIIKRRRYDIARSKFKAELRETLNGTKIRKHQPAIAWGSSNRLVNFLGKKQTGINTPVPISTSKNSLTSAWLFNWERLGQSCSRLKYSGLNVYSSVVGLSHFMKNRRTKTTLRNWKVLVTVKTRRHKLTTVTVRRRHSTTRWLTNFERNCNKLWTKEQVSVFSMKTTSKTISYMKWNVSEL